MRKYRFKDYDDIRDKLIEEGFTDNQMTFMFDETYVGEMGFFSFGFSNGHPILRHYYLDKEYRNKGIKNGFDLFKEFEKVMIDKGYTHFIGEVPKEKPELESCFRFLGANEPYAEVDGNKFYFVRVGGRRR